jgi:16S rRNA G966 N2-methylase RsmD
MVMWSEGAETKNDSSGEDQQQFTRPTDDKIREMLFQQQINFS